MLANMHRISNNLVLNLPHVLQLFAIWCMGQRKTYRRSLLCFKQNRHHELSSSANLQNLHPPHSPAQHRGTTLVLVSWATSRLEIRSHSSSGRRHLLGSAMLFRRQQPSRLAMDAAWAAAGADAIMLGPYAVDAANTVATQARSLCPIPHRSLAVGDDRFAGACHPG